MYVPLHAPELPQNRPFNILYFTSSYLTVTDEIIASDFSLFNIVNDLIGLQQL